jgi:hypothetical protein
MLVGWAAVSKTVAMHVTPDTASDHSRADLPVTARRWLSVGSSMAADPRLAGEAAAREALVGSSSRDPTARDTFQLHGGDVLTLNDQPALSAYLQQLGAPPEAYTDPVAFEEFAQSRLIGIRRRSGAEVRGISSPEFVPAGWLRSSGEVPEGVHQEFARMTGQAGDAPVARLYTWGEIGRTRGINGFHNQTLVVLAVG